MANRALCSHSAMTSCARFQVPEHDLQDLRERLRHTRWPPAWPSVGWQAGTDPGELRRLVERWANGYEWRAHEEAINALPAHRIEIDGASIYFLRFDAERGGAVPIVLTHGWPSSFLEMVELARRLSTPSAYGGAPENAFTAIVPALPGFPGTPQTPTLPPRVFTHELWHRLMADHLGFDRYGAHGGDLGAGVTSLLGQAHPEAVVGVHLLAVADPPGYDAATLTSEEQQYLDSVREWMAEAGGYEHEQMTRPTTLGVSLSDSPAGVLAWMAEKYRAWSDSDGVLANRFSDDFVLTQASLYWHTNSISTSFRPYYEYGRGMRPTLERVTVPTAVAVFPHDLSRPPRSWAERTYNVAHYTRMPRGGHFAAHEEPALLCADLAHFFRQLQ